MAVRGGLSPLSGLIWKTGNSVCQEYFTFVRKKLEKVREFQKILAVATMINGLAFHVYNQTPGILH